MKKILFLLTILVNISFQGAIAQHAPIIDMHLHAYMTGEYPEVLNRVTSKMPPETGAEHMRETLAEMERHGIVLGLISGSLAALDRWRAAAPEDVLLSAQFGSAGVDDYGNPLSLDTLRSRYATGHLDWMGEITAQYEGLSPATPELDPYFALAEEMDIPVGIHLGLGPPRTPYTCCPEFRTSLGNPQLLEEVLVRYPDLRIFLAHGGWPYLQETKAILHIYPQVYVDLSVINWTTPREEFHAHLEALIKAGFEDRLMFGSDQWHWPEVIGLAIEGIASAAFLTGEQKRKIFYDNAARFLRLSDEEIARHHGR